MADFLRDFAGSGVGRDVNKLRPSAATNNKHTTPMKTTLLLTVAVAGLMTLASRASAADALLSPKGKALADSFARVPGTTTDLIDRSLKTGSPKHLAMMESFRKVPGSTQDMIVRDGPTVPPKLLSNEPWRHQQYQVAPLK